MTLPWTTPHSPPWRVTGVLAAMVLLVACGQATPTTPSSSAASSPEPTVVPNPTVTPGPVTVSASEGVFRLVLTLAATTVPASAPVTGEAVLTTTNGRDTGIAGSGSGVIGFSFTELSGTRSMGYGMTADCRPYTIPARDGLRTRLSPTGGGWSEDDPNADFYAAFAQGRDVRLPAGVWRITAHASFAEAGCRKPSHDLEASTVVVITP